MGLMDNKDQIKTDITIALDVWKELLEELGEKIEYVYAKGSAIKHWDTEIDYVPHISDLDIHVKVINKERITPLGYESFGLAYELTEDYEQMFKEKAKEQEHECFHLPRIQLVQLNLHGNQGYNVPPREQDVTILKGNIKYKSEFPHNKVRYMDTRNVLKEKDFINSFSEHFFYLSSYEYFKLFFKMAGKVSPFPARLLNQILVNENPHDVWNWNRTKIVAKLNEHGFNALAEHYKQYYVTGWDLYSSKFENTDLFRQLLKFGYYVLFRTYHEILKIEENRNKNEL